MKTMFALTAFVSFVAGPVFAEKVDFPRTGEKIFEITIPDNWETDTDDDEIVEATSPEQNISLMMWEIESETKVESLTNDLKDILAEYATDVELFEEPRAFEVSGLNGIFFSGHGKDVDDADHEVGFVSFAFVKGDKAAIVYFELDDNFSKDELKKFESIIESITTPEGK